MGISYRQATWNDSEEENMRSPIKERDFSLCCPKPNFSLNACQNLAKRDFTFKTERMTSQKKGKREYLTECRNKGFHGEAKRLF